MYKDLLIGRLERNYSTSDGKIYFSRQYAYLIDGDIHTDCAIGDTPEIVGTKIGKLAKELNLEKLIGSEKL